MSSRPSPMVLACLLIVWAAARISAEPLLGAPDAQAAPFIAALKERRLDGLLEYYLRQQLAGRTNDPLSPALAVELSSLYAERAAESADEAQRAALWKFADEVLRQAINHSSDYLLHSQLTIQRSSVALAQGEWLRGWDELAGYTDQAPSAIEPLARSVSWAREAEESLSDRLKDEADRSPTRHPEEIERIQNLAGLARLRLGTGELALALSRPPGDPQRALGLEQVVELCSATSPADPSDALNIPTQLLRIEALRRLGRSADAWPVLEGVRRQLPADAAPAIRDRLLREQLELLLAEGRVVESLELVVERRQASPVPEPEWEYLYLKALLHQAKLMPSEPEAVGKLQASALRQLRLLDRLPDRIWSRRGEVLLSQHADVLLLRDAREYRQAGEILVRSGKLAQAAAVYRQAADQAIERGDSENAVGLLEESARCWGKAQEHEQARNTLLELVDRWPAHPMAAEASLQAALEGRQAYLAHRLPADYERLRTQVDQHLERFPVDSTSDEIRYLKGTMLKAERKYEEAIDSFLSVSPTHRLFPMSRIAASRLYEQWKRPLEPDAPSDDTLGKVIIDHESLLASSGPEFRIDQRAELTLRLVRFLLDLRVDRTEDARARLEELLTVPGLSHQSIESARRYMILALVRRNEHAAAESMADLQARSSLDELAASVELLHQQAAISPEVDRAAIGRVQARLIAFVRPQIDRLPPEERIPWELSLARIDLHLGKDDQLRVAIQRLEDLRKESPNDPRIIELLALCYMRSHRFESAIVAWRQLVGGLEEGTQLWFRAKLHLIESLRQSGQVRQARSTLRLLEVLHPDLGGPQLREQFQAENALLPAETSY